MRLRAAVFALVLCVAAPAGVAAQNRRLPPPNPRPAPDFFFGQPNGSLGIRGSRIFPRAGSDWYDFVTDQLTLETGDFVAPAFALDVGIIAAPRLEVLAGLEVAKAETGSEYRRFVDNNRLPIEQNTKVRQFNVSGSVKVPLLSRGREVSQLAWVPRRVVPYAGAGGGMLWYEVEQIGDFIDYVDLSVFSDVFRSRGWTPSAHVFGGVDVRLIRRLFATVDVRYLWAAGDLGQEWVNFDPIDLAGARVSAGINVVF
jgi:hypothetical protein